MASPLFLLKILHLKKRLVYFIPAILCFLFTFYLLTIPGKKLPQIDWIGKFQIDKLVHICMFFTLCFLFSYPLKNVRKKYSIILLIAFAGLIYGIVMEFVQKYFIPFRSCEVTDMLADGAGSFLAYWWMYRKFKKEAAVG